MLGLDEELEGAKCHGNNSWAAAVGGFALHLFHPLHRCKAKQETECRGHRRFEFFLGMDAGWMGCSLGVGHKQGRERSTARTISHGSRFSASAHNSCSEEMPRVR